MSPMRAIAKAFDTAILSVAPVWGANRARARLQALAYSRAYEAAEPGRLRRSARDHGSGNAATAGSAEAIRNMARHHDRNHDLVVGAFNTLVQNIVGPNGITVEPQPRNAAGDIDEKLVDVITPLHRAWCKRPEVTWSHNWAGAQRIAGLSWFRDGDLFVQDLLGPVAGLTHGGSVPYSIELLEGDMVPLDLDDPTRRIVQGVELNAWRRAVAYHVYLEHPGEPGVFMPRTKRVSADFVRHLKLVRRIGQVRGVSMLASVLTRLDDLKDYEESERIAAKIAASMAAFIVKGQPDLYVEPSDTVTPGGVPQSPKPRNIRFQPGMVFDDLRPGESVGTVDTTRPNANLQSYRNGQLKAGAAGMCISYSSFAKDYSGTYSAQRQELVEQYGAYGVLGNEFCSAFVMPSYENFIRAAVLSRQIRLPAGTTIEMASDALYQLPQMPWIDPLKEAKAFEILEDNAYASGPEIIRRRGGNPRDVLDQQSAWLARKKLWNIPARQGSAAHADVADEPDGPPNLDDAPPMNNPSQSRVQPRVLNQVRASAAAHDEPFPQGASTLAVRALSADSAELLVYGPIGESWWGESVTAMAVVKQLATVHANTIHVRINSGGGSVSDGVAIFNALKAHSGRKIVTVDGIAASVASLIAMAGDEVRMPANSLMMIHAPWTTYTGHAGAFRDAAEALDAYAAAMLTSYTGKTGKPASDIEPLLTDGKDHYYTAAEAVAFGLADVVVGDAAEADEPATATAALHSYVSALAKAPSTIAAALRKRVAGCASERLFARLSAAVQAAVLPHIEDSSMQAKLHAIMASAGAAAPAAQPVAPPAAAAPAAPQASAPAAPVAAAVDPIAAIAARNTRIVEICGQFAHVPAIAQLQVAALTDPSMTVEKVYDQVLAACAQNAQPLGRAVSATAGVDERDRQIDAAVNAILARHNVISGAERDRVLTGNPYAYTRVSAMAEQSLKRRGVDTSGMARDDIAVMALQTPSDFPILLENALNKTVIAGYRAAPFTWSRFCRIGALTDYRAHNRYQFGSIGNLQAPNGNAGEYNNAALSDGRKETITGTRKGRILSVTPELIVNDDLGAILDAATALGIAAGRTIEDAVYALLALNSGLGPTMADGNALFNAAHANIAGTAGAPTVSTFEATRVMLASQRGPGDGADYADAMPAIFVGPLSTGGAARVVNTSTYDPDTANKLQRTNIVLNMLRDIVDTPRLTGNRWYMFADPATHPVLEVAFVEGRQQPRVTEAENFRSSAREWKVEHSWGAGAVSWMGCATNAGG